MTKWPHVGFTHVGEQKKKKKCADIIFGHTSVRHSHSYMLKKMSHTHAHTLSSHIHKNINLYKLWLFFSFFLLIFMQVQIFKFLNHFNSFTFYRNVENKQCLSRKDFVCLIGIFCLLNRNHRSLGILGLLTHIYTTPTHTQTHTHTPQS